MPDLDVGKNIWDIAVSGRGVNNSGEENWDEDVLGQTLSSIFDSGNN